MTLKEFIKNMIFKFKGVEKLESNPDDERLTYISNDEAIKLDEVKACKIWFVGDGNELLNYYTHREVIGFNDNPIYNRNNRNYFWGLSSQECAIKRIHSGIPNAIITTLSNVIGYPQIKTPDNELWDEIERENSFKSKLTQQSRPLTCAEGWGAWKPNFDKELSNYPIWEYYEAQDVEYILRSGMLFGIIYKSYYKDSKNKKYVLLETRYRQNGNSYIKYELFRYKKGDEIERCEFECLPELAYLKDADVVIPGLDRVLGVPSKYFFDPMNQKYGKSIFAGKLDLFDMLDEILSQASQTNRVSTPVEYYSPDILERGNNGLTGMPNLYNRQFIQKAGIPDGEGGMKQDIITTQPELNFDKYGYLASNVLDYIFTGVLSPASLGIDVAKKDNAEAQREKEKITMFSRDNIIDKETEMIKDIVELSFMLKEYIDKGSISINDIDISVKYNEFASPTFEVLAGTLTPMFTGRAMSTEMFVEKLYGDSLSPEEKQAEIDKLNELRKQDDVDLGELLGNGTESGINESLDRTGETEETVENAQEPVSI